MEERANHLPSCLAAPSPYPMLSPPCCWLHSLSETPAHACLPACLSFSKELFLFSFPPPLQVAGSLISVVPWFQEEAFSCFDSGGTGGTDSHCFGMVMVMMVISKNRPMACCSLCSSLILSYLIHCTMFCALWTLLSRQTYICLSHHTFAHFMYLLLWADNKWIGVCVCCV